MAVVANRDPADLTVAEVVSATRIPVERWIADCFGIALAITDRGLVDGVPSYRFCMAPTHPDSPLMAPDPNDVAWTSGMAVVLPDLDWAEVRAGLANGDRLGFHEGVVLLADGRIMDAHRWIYEMVAPYIWVGPSDEYHDVLTPDLRDYIDHLRPELEAGMRGPYDGSLRICQHDSGQRKLAAQLLRPALKDPWFQPLYDLAALA